MTNPWKLITDKTVPGPSRAELLSDADRPVRREFGREGETLRCSQLSATGQQRHPGERRAGGDGDDIQKRSGQHFERHTRCGLNTAWQLSMEDVPTMILCKPKLLPLKSVTLEKLEKMQMEAQEAVKQQELALKEQ
ncbi:BBSome-interacting protein 1 [Collichthys lucidus]|uniref:BBSome-interacting protein 1 n=1 Tax=Collichthys lucidus TaxID=240159 RepID=A0A4U5U7I1_COLLU|nr:BBSome-interacting protein 1 [Collichthys lucidus]